MFQLWLERREICLESAQKQDGSVDLAWKSLLWMVDKLGQAGMSSDESDLDDNTGRPCYTVERRVWRSPEVQACLEGIDKFANRSAADGRIRPGNQPRQRIRMRSAKASRRDPPIGCPRNYYTAEFLSDLSNRAGRELDVKEGKALVS